MNCLISTKVIGLLRTVRRNSYKLSELLYVQRLSKAEWNRSIPADAVLQTVLDKFCERFCLPTCHMLHAGRLLQPGQKLIQVLLLQYRS